MTRILKSLTILVAINDGKIIILNVYKQLRVGGEYLIRRFPLLISRIKNSID